jgi:hypothetical protein
MAVMVWDLMPRGETIVTSPGAGPARTSVGWANGESPSERIGRGTQRRAPCGQAQYIRGCPSGLLPRSAL